MSENLDSRVAKHDVEIRELKRRMSALESSNEALNEIAINSQRLTTLIDLTQIQLEKNTTVMQEMHTNLIGLNHEMKEIRDDMDSVDSRVSAFEDSRYASLKERETERRKNYAKIAVAVITALSLAYLGLN